MYSSIIFVEAFDNILYVNSTVIDVSIVRRHIRPIAVCPTAVEQLDKVRLS